ncbi:MAG: O-antigen ligase family protein, partial [Aeoliella sp.]
MYNATATKRLFPMGRIVEWRWEDRLPQIVDACLWSLVVLAPFAWGGRHDAARFLYALLASVACSAWIAQSWLRQDMRWTFTPALLIPVLAAGWLIFQIMPLPSGAIDWLSPRIAELLPLWRSDSASALLGQSGWSTLSVNPHATQTALAMLLCYALIFFVALQRLKTHSDVIVLLLWLGVAAAVMALFGLLQYCTADGLFFWVYEHPFRQTDQFVCGSFINRNHFASFLAMGAAAIAFRIVQGKSETQKTRSKRSRRPQSNATNRLVLVWTVLLAVVSLALLMSFSRGAAVAAAAGTVVLAVIYWRGKLWGAKQVGCLLMTVVLLGSGLTLYTDDRLTNRLDDLTAGSIEELDRFGGRRMIWNANLHAISDGWLTGAGAGTHRDIYPVYFTESWPKVFTHAENGYLQIATETGLPGVLLLAAVFVNAILWSVKAWSRSKSSEQLACLGAILAALTVSAIHSFVDFVWYIPATMTVVVLLLAALCRLANIEAPEERMQHAPISRHGRRDLTLGLGGAAIVMLYILAGPALAARSWDQYYADSARHEVFQESAFEKLVATGDPHCLGYGGSHLQAKAVSMRKVVNANPHSAGAHLRLAQAYLQGFDVRAGQRDNRMGLAQLQATVASGGFTSAEEVKAW